MTKARHRERLRPSNSSRVSERSDRSADEAPEASAGAAEAERKLARRVAVVAPVVTILGGALVGAITSIGPGILVLAGGALFGTIAFFWASLRTLGGDAPLAEGFGQMTRRRVEAADGVTERKRTALRALKDLEFDHALGKIGDKDYAELSARYREQAKAILREIEGAVLPQRARAEELARAYLAKRGTGLASVKPREGNTGAVLARAGERVTCTRCQASNEKDAVFCKGCGATLGE
jgi:hypothetical protein